MNRTKIWEIGGFLAGAVLIVFGVVAIVLGVSGYRTVHNELNQQYIVGSGDMTPAAIQQEAKSAGLSSSVSLPTCNVAEKSVDTGAEARCCSPTPGPPRSGAWCGSGPTATILGLRSWRSTIGS